MQPNEGRPSEERESAQKLAADARRARLNLLITNLSDGRDVSNQLRRAIEKYTHAIEAAPAEIGTYLELAELCFQHDRHQQAIEVCDEIIAQDPDCARAYQQRGLAHSHLDRRDQAIADCNAAVRLAPSVDTLHTRADVHSWFEDYANAVADCDRAIELAPNCAECFAKRAVLLSEWYYESEVTSLVRRAIDDETRAIQLEPSNSDHLRLRGRSYLDLRRFDEAIADLSRCIEIEPDYYLNYEIRGEAFLKVNQPELALQDLTQSISLNPESSYSYQYRAKAYRIVGQLQEADRDEARCQELDPIFHRD